MENKYNFRIILLIWIVLCILSFNSLLIVQNIKTLNNKIIELEQQNNELQKTISQNKAIPIIVLAPRAISSNNIEEEKEFINIYSETISNLTDYEKELICRITFREAGNQCIEGKRAVMEVILNRVLCPLFPNTVEGVLSQPGQFSTWSNRHSVTEEQLEAMTEILEMVATEEETILSLNYVYFNNAPSAFLQTNMIQIQDHYFGTY